MTTERTFVFADLAGYTALTEAHGDDDAAQIATRFYELVRACLPEGVELVKTIGDAVMLAAVDEAAGVAAAIAVARSCEAQSAFPALRVGLHAGPAVERDRDYFGAAVNVAARVAAFARGGEIACTERIAEVAVARGLAAARPMGTVQLKNVVSPVALYELDTHDRAARQLLHVDPVCRMQVLPADAAAQHVHDGTTLYFCSRACAERFAEAPASYMPTV